MERKKEWKKYWQKISLNTHWDKHKQPLCISARYTNTFTVQSQLQRGSIAHSWQLTSTWPSLQEKIQPPERCFLCRASSPNPKRHALGKDSTWASSEGADQKILMMMSLSLISALSCSQPYVWKFTWSRGQAGCSGFEEHKLMTCRDQNRLWENGHLLLQNSRPGE